MREPPLEHMKHQLVFTWWLLGPFFPEHKKSQTSRYKKIGNACLECRNSKNFDMVHQTSLRPAPSPPPPPFRCCGQCYGSGSKFRDPGWTSRILLLRTWIGLKLLAFFDADPGSFQPWIRNPGWEKIGYRIFIPDPQHWLWRYISLVIRKKRVF
jgi:hypothetical protein